MSRAAAEFETLNFPAAFAGTGLAFTLINFEKFREIAFFAGRPSIIGNTGAFGFYRFR